MTADPTKAPAEPAAAARRRAAHVERQLDEALDASFPASDPIAIVTSQHEEDWDEEPAEPER